MAKVLLVEDDNNLREIYQARLLAEGYDIVAAQNGEEALVVAKQNKPDLIISDVMMPRISGFEMLDILRNTEGLKHTKVIMLTALGQTEDQKRADNLGADKYLVKSQVTLEDIVNAAKELLNEDGGIADVPPPPEPAATEAVPAEPAAVEAPAPAAAVEPASAPVSVAPAPEPAVQAPVAVAPEPVAPAAVVTPAPAATPAEPVAPAPVAAQPVAAPADAPAPAPADTPTPAVTAVPAPAPAADPTASASAAVTDAAAQTMAAEEKALEDQIASYAKEPGVDPPAVDPAPAPAEANNAATITAAVNELNAPVVAEPIQPPSVLNAPAPTPEVAPAPAAETPAVAAVSAPASAPEPVVAAPAAAPATPVPDNNNVTVAGKKIIQPISAPADKPNLDALLAKEEANEPAPVAAPVIGAAATQPAAPQTPPMPAHTPGQSFDPSKAL